MQNSRSTRRPAEIVKCPYCTWKGSARGLHSHCRLLHGKNIKDAKEIKVNPYAINKESIKTIKKKSSIGSIYDKKYSDTPLENILIIIGLSILSKWMLDEIDTKRFQSECNKLKLDANKMWSASQDIKSPQRPTTTPIS